MAENLSDAWKGWTRFLRDHDPATDSATVGARLRRFAPAHALTAEHVDAVADAIYRGVPLLQSALYWEAPRVGGTADKVSPTDKVRGEQWRLVIAYGGFETVARAVLDHPRRRDLEAGQIMALLARCAPPEYRPIAVPAHSEAVRERWFGSAPAELLEFLGLDGEDAQSTYRWLADRQPIVSWASGLGLAKALRNATASGALSASKVKEWKLQPAMRALVEDLATVTAAVLTKLNAPDTPPPPAPDKAAPEKPPSKAVTRRSKKPTPG